MPDSTRLAVRKTYKLYIGGAFPRSESGRTYLVNGDNVALASRKDARDAVIAARKAQPKWAGATAYNRGQILYRVAEMLEARRAEFVALGVGRDRGGRGDRPAGSGTRAGPTRSPRSTARANPVAGPYFNLSAPEPTGVVGVVAPASLLGLVSVIAPAIVTGNTVVVLAPGPQAAVTLAEVLATSDLPGGVVNILTGDPAETAPWLASHDDVNALDLTGVDDAGAGRRSGAGRGRQPQAGAAPAAGRDGLRRRPGSAPDDRPAGDQDGVAPEGFLVLPDSRTGRPFRVCAQSHPSTQRFSTGGHRGHPVRRIRGLDRPLRA